MQEIDIGAIAPIISQGAVDRAVIERPREIVAKKIVYRGRTFPVPDISTWHALPKRRHPFRTPWTHAPSAFPGTTTSLGKTCSDLYLRTARCTSARIAFEACAVAHQGEVAAIAAGFAFVALGAGFGAFLGRGLAGVDAGVGKGERVQRMRGRKPLHLLGRGFERG
jgi:hypothetical protein